MVVVTIIGLLAALALPAFKRAGIAARASALANDFRVFSAAFQTYSQQNGGYPKDTGTDVMPPAMAEMLGKTGWLTDTPIGGFYNWEYNKKAQGVTYTAAIGVRTKGQEKIITDQKVLQAIDQRIDDGNLKTGNFLLGPGNAPYYVIER